MTAVLAASAALAFLSATGGVDVGEEPPGDEPVEVVAAPETVPETVPAETTTTTIPEKTGEIDGVEVAVGLPPVPPHSPPTEVGTVDGVEVAVGPPPVPPVTAVAARPSAQNVGASSREPNAASAVTSRRDAVVAATQLIESMQTIDVLLDAWS